MVIAFMEDKSILFVKWVFYMSLMMLHLDGKDEDDRPISFLLSNHLK